MIKIDINLFATLSKYLPEDNGCFEVSDETTVEKLITDLEIPKELAKLIFVNGKQIKINYKLKNEDRVGIFPPVGGG